MVTYLICSELDLLTSVLEDEPPIYYPNRCPKINVTPYLGERIEYQYPDEPIETIFADGGELSYQFEERVIQEAGILYHVFGTFIDKRWFNCNKTWYWRTAYPIFLPVTAISKDSTNRYRVEYNDSNNQPQTMGIAVITLSQYQNLFVARLPFVAYFYERETCYSGTGINFGKDPVATEVARADGLPEITECEFTVSETFYNSNNVVIRHQETRDVCPNVQQFSCETGQSQTINLNLDVLEPLFITTSSEFALQNGTLNEGFDISEIINFLAGNPDNCLLIWKLERNFGFFYSITQIAQICSPAGCPPPEYNYECLDCCLPCPPNTCAVECGDRVCCYGSDGVAVESIPIGEYCNE